MFLLIMMTPELVSKVVCPLFGNVDDRIVLVLELMFVFVLMLKQIPFGGPPPSVQYCSGPNFTAFEVAQTKPASLRATAMMSDCSL